MAIATDLQVQGYVNDHVRPRAEQIRALWLACKDDKFLIDDIYQALTQQSPTWTDNFNVSAPHLLTPADVLGWNTFITGFLSLVEGGLQADRDNAAAQFTVVMKACTRPVQIL